MLWHVMSLVLVMVAALTAAATEPSLAQHTSTVAGSEAAVGLEMSQLFLRTSTPDRNARVYLGRGDNAFSVGMNSQGAFSVALAQPAKVANTPAGLSVQDKDLLVVTPEHVAASHVIARAVATEQLRVNGVAQWQLAQEDAHFSKDSLAGWTAAGSVMQCGPLGVLAVEEGGKAELRKVFSQLPRHSQVRIVATGHFIDDWQGETAYLKVNGHYAWTEAHELRNAARSLNLCGSDKFPETKFTVAIDVTIPAQALQQQGGSDGSTVEVAFGTTTDAHSLARFGVSTVAVYVRDA